MNKIEIKLNGQTASLLRFKNDFYIKYNGERFKCGLNDITELIKGLNLLRVSGPTDLLTLICDYFIRDKEITDFMEKINVKPKAKNLITLVLGKSRKREIVKIRQSYAYYAKQIYIDKTLKTIGQSLGKRDHSTIIHSIQTFNDLKNREYKQIKEDLDLILLNKQK